MDKFDGLRRTSGDDFEDRRGKPPKGERGKKEGLPWRSPGRSLFFWLVIILSVLLIYNFFGEGTADTATITYSDFLRYVGEGKISSVIFIDRNLNGKFTEEITIAGSTGSGKYKKFQLRIPFDDPSLVDKLTAAGISINAKEQGTNWGGVLLTVAPWFLIIFVWLFFMRQMQGGGAGGSKGIFSFGKSRAKLLTDERPKVTFADVAGADEAKQELSEVIDFLKDPGKFQKLGGKIPKGALLLGPPGTGKTLLARAVAGEAGVPFFSMSGSDFVEMFVGVGASRVRDLFDQGKKHAPCIIFIDEIDAVGRHRGAGLGGGHDEREQTLNQLLVEMDGFESNDGVILLAATNRPDVLDPALLRPGRFDRQIVVDVPDVRGREGIFKVHTREGQTGRGRRPDGPGPRHARPVGSRYRQPGERGGSAGGAQGQERRGYDRFRRGQGQGDDGGGTQVDGDLRPGEEDDRLSRKRSRPPGQAGAESRSGAQGDYRSPRAGSGGDPLPARDERHTYDREYLEGHLICMMGGRVAEKLIYDYVTTGAGKDIEQATELARKMVCNWGMSDRIGPLGFGRRQEQIFLGREIQQPRDYSEATAQLIDAEIKRFVEDAQKKATELLQANVDKLEKLAEALLEKEILDGSEIDRIIGIEPQQPEPAPDAAPRPD